LRSRLDQELVKRGLVTTRSQAESFIRLGEVIVDGRTVTKPGAMVLPSDDIKLTVQQQYVSRAGLKLASVVNALKLDFNDKVVLDVGSSTGGFTDYSLQNGAKHVIAVDVGTDQLHHSLRVNPKIELYEQTDIRDVSLGLTGSGAKSQEIKTKAVIINCAIDIVVIDVSFISLREILPHISKLLVRNSVVVAMVKPQFEAGNGAKHKGVIKNDRMRRDILQSFEQWVSQYFVIRDKSDSQVAGVKGNRERFYLLKQVQL
jgi:23S rRNA (cytidine1920-2'-O)/16S rRNA (cytidine1409-2'-O)-methyltransferase